MNIKNNVKNITLDILERFLFAAEDLLNPSLSKKSAYQVLNGQVKHKWTLTNFSKLLQGLKRSGYIEIKETRNGKSIVLTNKTKIKLLDKIASNNKPDGKFRFVSFDIPEKLKSQRNQFRKAIKKLGFKQIQQSLWVCDRNIGRLVELASLEFNVGKYIIYIISEKSDADVFIDQILKNDK